MKVFLVLSIATALLGAFEIRSVSAEGILKDANPSFTLNRLYSISNPKAHFKKVLSYRTMDWPSEPQIVLKFESQIDAGDVEIKITDSAGKSLFQKARIKPGMNLAELSMSDEFSRSGKLAIHLYKGSDEIWSLGNVEPAPNHIIAGVVRDMDGSPVEGALVVVLHTDVDQFVLTDKLGQYRFSLPENDWDAIAALDERYPTERLEDYIWDLHLDRDRQIDFKIGNAEVFRLTAGAMKQNKVIAGTFISWTSPLLNSFIEKEKPKSMDHPGFFSPKYTSRLTANDVNISLNGCPLKGPLSLERTDILFPDKGGRIVKKFGYKFEVRYSDKCPILPADNELMVEVSDAGGAKGRARIFGIGFM